MSTYPVALDTDSDIVRVDDDITEIGGEAINQCRDAIFNVEAELGIGLSGTKGDLATRLDESINANGTIKGSALTAVGLVTLPIDNAQVGTNAGIAESKLSLTYGTSALNDQIVANKALFDVLKIYVDDTLAVDLTAHLTGATFLSDGSTTARHVASHINLDSPSGLTDKDGATFAATEVGAALTELNTNLTTHENLVAGAHPASAITVDASDFTELSNESTTLQEVLENVDGIEGSLLGTHRATHHTNGIAKSARAESLVNDGYGEALIPSTAVTTYLSNGVSAPKDDNLTGDDIIEFNPAVSKAFDALFVQVKPGDIITVTYTGGVQTSFEIESIRYSIGVSWRVRINGTNLADGTGTARIDRPKYDSNTAGILVVAACNPDYTVYPNTLSSLIVGHPRAATAVGLAFEPNQLDSTHYNLYLELYPTGNPVDHVISLAAIDVTGDAGVSPGEYTLRSVVQATNNKFRALGYNYRFIAFEHDGQFGIMLADKISNAGFAIITGDNTSGTLDATSYPNNVIDEVSILVGGDAWAPDALGFGSRLANLASPKYLSAYFDGTAAQYPTKVISPRKYRYFTVNGKQLDDFRLQLEPMQMDIGQLLLQEK